MPSPPLALTPALPSELLTYVLAHQVYPTNLVICQSRDTFLASLLSIIPQPIQRQPPPPPDDNTNAFVPPITEEPEEALPPEPEPEPPQHPLLTPSLHQIASSRHVNVVFIPTVSHLRAYLTAFPPPKEKDENGGPPELRFDKPGKKVPLLIMYGLVDLHKNTSEWSAQGLGNTVAGLVEAGWRGEKKVVVIEERKVEDDGEEMDIEGEQPKRNPRWKVWEERVPMLNGSVKRAGFESEDSAWSGRTIEVGRIFARWFKFRKGDWDIE
ncbi:uncharacterized protein PAC_14868 [Phialocephala subalpina]|uniref:Uncharacterized protein n=1 Tax=Phialocephala subalpina TaxID=576137 RepID=A0A1L7XIX1_9HELO|nr:uncharacterized protein PAC_14868 [Phialocephala subalpina]